MTKENDELDAKVLIAIRSSSGAQAHWIQGEVAATCRELDRSLQRLRKDGKIRFAGHRFGWQIKGG